jgi:hypothetical protein
VTGKWTLATPNWPFSEVSWLGVNMLSDGKTASATQRSPLASNAMPDGPKKLVPGLSEYAGVGEPLVAS